MTSKNSEQHTINDLTLYQMVTIDKTAFKGSIIHYKDNKFICIYHNSSKSRLASCFLEQYREGNEIHYKYVPGTRTCPLHCDFRTFIDPRLVKYNNKYYVSFTTWYPRIFDHLTLIELEVKNKITFKQVAFKSCPTIRNWPEYKYIREKNWIPWIYKDAIFFYTYSVNPHRILKITEDNNLELCYSTKWKCDDKDFFWNKMDWFNQNNIVFRLNATPILLSNGVYLSTFHTCKMITMTSDYHRNNETVLGYYNGFFTYESTPPFRVLQISKVPYQDPYYKLSKKWPYLGPPTSAVIFYPLSLVLKDDIISLMGTTCDATITYTSIPLNKILNTMVNVTSYE